MPPRRRTTPISTPSTSAATRARRARWARAEEQHRWKLSLLRAFVAKRGLAALYNTTRVAPGVAIGKWAAARRRDHRNRTLAPWLRDELAAIPGWSWDHPRDARMRRRLVELQRFVTDHAAEGGLAALPRRSPLAVWVQHRQLEHRRGALVPWIRAPLARIPGWVWSPREAKRDRRLAALTDYVTRHGWAGLGNIKRPTVWQGVNLSRWIANIRSGRARGHLSLQMTRAIETIPGWEWNPIDAVRRQNLALLAGYLRAMPLTELRSLSVWIRKRRRDHRRGALAPDFARRLESLPGWRW